MNSLTIKGKSNDVKEMFGLQRNDNLEDFLHNNYVSLRTWFPMPQTFCDVDTVNSKCKRDDKNLETQMPLFNSDEEYEEYSRKYDEAVEYLHESVFTGESSNVLFYFILSLITVSLITCSLAVLAGYKKEEK